MIYRTALLSDIPQLQLVRNAVRENRLSDPALIADGDYIDFITIRGKGWVCLIEDQVAGFVIVDLLQHNIWALFVHPDYEGRGIGRRLHDDMLDWYFEQTDTTVWLSTTPKTRAAAFYTKAGWIETGLYGRDEIQFEMSRARWRSRLIL
jgi:GNAT superfamily N-acetyltransferase